MSDLESAAFSIWTCLVTGEAPSADDLARTALASWADLQAIFLTCRPFLEFRTDQADALHAATGLSLIASGALASEGFDPPFWIARDRSLQHPDEPYAAKRQRREVVNSAGKLQDEMLRSGALELRSPFDGRMRRSTASFVMDFRRSEGLRAVGHQTLYFFSDGPPLFALFGGEDNWPMAWFDPVANLVIRERGFIEIDRFFSYAIAQVQSLFIRNPERVTNYIRVEHRRTSTAWIGGVDYISTHFYSDLCGLDRAISAGAIQVADLIAVAARPVFGSIHDLYPELDSSKIETIDAPDVEALNLILMTRNCFTVRLAGGFARNDTARRVIARSARMADGDHVSQINGLRSLGYPVLFIALRVHNRRWLQPVEAFAAMLNRLALVAGGLSVILDGYALSPEDPVPDAIMETERVFLEKLTGLLSPDIGCVVSAGRTLADAIVATDLADFHLSTQGTTTTKAVLIAGLPGVVIGPDSFWWSAADYIEDDVPCTVVGPGKATDVDPVAWPVTDFHLPICEVEAALADGLAALAASATRRRPISL